MQMIASCIIIFHTFAVVFFIFNLISLYFLINNSTIYSIHFLLYITHSEIVKLNE